MRKQLTVIISGQVQGVGYRMFAASHAHRLRLTGFVRNLPGGDVEVVAEGEEEALSSFLEILREGPPAGRVTDMQVFRSNDLSGFESFTIQI